MAWLSRSHVFRIAIDPRHSGHRYLCVWWEGFYPGGTARAAIPAAAGAFVHWGLTLPMSIGALAMNLSTVIVAVNAQFLRQFTL
jgi:Cu2+-exporting ATPase